METQRFRVQDLMVVPLRPFRVMEVMEVMEVMVSGNLTLIYEIFATYSRFIPSMRVFGFTVWKSSSK